MWSVVIPAYIVNHELIDITRKCVASYKDADEVLLINNGSPVISDLPYAAHVVKNAGFTGGNNVGLALARGDYIIVSNNDIIMPDYWKEELQKMFDAGADIAHFRLSHDTHAEGISYNDFIGPFWAMKREAFEKIGLLDLNFTGGGAFSDNDYKHRASLLGLTIMKNNDVVIFHDSSATMKRVDEHDPTHSDPNKEYFIKKWGVDNLG